VKKTRSTAEMKKNASSKPSKLSQKKDTTVSALGPINLDPLDAEAKEKILKPVVVDVKEKFSFPSIQWPLKIIDENNEVFKTTPFTLCDNLWCLALSLSHHDGDGEKGYLSVN
jgi:hypothetical protein